MMLIVSARFVSVVPREAQWMSRLYAGVWWSSVVVVVVFGVSLFARVIASHLRPASRVSIIHVINVLLCCFMLSRICAFAHVLIMVLVYFGYVGWY